MADALKSIRRDGHLAVALGRWPDRPDVKHLFGVRGERPVEFLAGYFGVPTAYVAGTRQVHGHSVWVLDGEAPPDADGWTGPVRSDCPPGASLPVPEEGFDALVTNRPGIALSVRTADCVPILIWDQIGRAIGAVHAGWRGSLRSIASKTVRRMENCFGTRPADLWIAIGPAVGPCCYEVDRAVLDPLRSGFSDWREVVAEKGLGRGMLDLPGLNVRQLLGCGVPSGRITVAGTCTVCHPDGFYSYRRDGRSAGSMISGILVCDRKGKDP